MTRLLAKHVERRLGPHAPLRYVSFLRDEEYEKLEYLELRSGFVEGRYLPDFANFRLLSNIRLLSEAAGVAGLDERTWRLEFPQFAPLAVLEPTERHETRQDVGAFLVIKVTDERCPVYLLVREGRMLIPVAPSLTAFVDGVICAATSPDEHRNVGYPYEAYGWSSSSRRPARPRSA
jgi:hypothetical protein